MINILRDELRSLLSARQGHFQLESGHHGDLWLDLDALMLFPARLMPFAEQLAQGFAAQGAEAICGPLAGGAFLAQMIATRLDCAFYYAERSAPTDSGALYAARYRLPEALRGSVRGKAVAIVDDVINAGSALRATFADLQACGARVVAIGALLALNNSAADFAAAHGAALLTIAQLPSGLWLPADCPLCAAGMPLENLTP